MVEHLSIDCNGKLITYSDKTIKLLFILMASPIKPFFNVHINQITVHY